MLAFLPWSTIERPLAVGAFEVASYSELCESNQIPEELRDSIVAILTTYDRRRPVDQNSVPIVRRRDLAWTAELDEQQINEYFDFRTALAFSALSARQFFASRYANSDSLRLIVQGFAPERPDSIMLLVRRRDGLSRHIISKEAQRFLRPEHVSHCDLNRDLDSDLLAALESARDGDPDRWETLDEAIRLFVGANTDSPDVGTHGELIDIISAYSRLANHWKEEETVRAFLASLPTPEQSLKAEGPKAALDRVAEDLARGKSMREIWLRDAYRLRNQVGHGHVQAPRPGIWNAHEHLLLLSLNFPLYIKMLLVENGHYQHTDRDIAENKAFDALASLDAFQGADEDWGKEWRDTITRALLEPGIQKLAAAMQADARRLLGRQRDDSATRT